MEEIRKSRVILEEYGIPNVSILNNMQYICILVIIKINNY